MRTLFVAALLTGLAFAQQTSVSPAPKPAPTPGVTNATPAPAVKPDKATAYYHYSLGRMYEEDMQLYGRSELIPSVLAEYKAALAADPSAAFIRVTLAEFYARTGHIRDSVTEAESLIQADPDNLDARKLLGRIYLRSLGDMQSGPQSQEMLRRAIEQFQQITRLEPNEIEDHLLLGRLYRLNNQSDKAEQEFKSALKLQPNSEEAIVSLAYLYNEQNKGDQAIALLDSLPNGERSAKMYSALGYSYEQQKNYKKAVEAYRKAVEQDRENLDAVRGFAQNLLNDGQYQAALEQYKQIADADPQDAQAWLRIAEIYRHTGKYDLALEALKKADALVSGDSLEVPYNMALIYEAQGRYDDAITQLNALLQKTSHANNVYTPGERANRAIFIERLGNIYREERKTDQALQTFRSLTQGSNDESASRGYQEMIDTYREVKDWPQATAVAKEAAEKFPKDKNVQLMYASLLADNGQTDAALTKVKSLLSGTPEDRDIYIGLAQIQGRLRHYKEAQDALDLAEKASTTEDDRQNVTFIRGSLFEREKKYDLAEQSFRKVLAGDPQNAMALNYLGYMLADHNTRLDEALALVKKAVELDPQNGAYLDSLGWAYFKLGSYDLAEENLRKASDRVGNDGTIQDHLGDLYLKTGRLKQAVMHWERALAEWNRTVSAEVEPSDVSKTQKKLESARVKLAQQGGADK